MPLYYFKLVDSRLVSDYGIHELADDTVAQVEALKLAQSLRENSPSSGRPTLFDIGDERNRRWNLRHTPGFYLIGISAERLAASILRYTIECVTMAAAMVQMTNTKIFELRAYNLWIPVSPGRSRLFSGTALKSLMGREGRQSKLQSNPPNILNTVGRFLQFFIPLQLPLGLMPELIFSAGELSRYGYWGE